MQRAIHAGRLSFTADAAGALLFITVSAPSDKDNSADQLQALVVARSIGRDMGGPRIGLTKSTYQATQPTS